MFKFVEDIKDADCITHGAKFHADDIFSTVIMDKIIDNMKIIRVIDVPEEYKKRNDKIIYDIGWGELDHHQKGGNGQRENGIRYAAFGLIWRKYGKNYLRKIDIKEEFIDLVWNYLDEEFVQLVDSIDNGQLDLGCISIPVVTVSDVLNYYNPNWNEDKTYDEGFKEAFIMAEKIWNQKVISVLGKAEAKAEVDNAIDKSENCIVILDKYMPYQDFVINSDNPKAKEILYAIYPSNRGGYGIQAIQKAVNTFENRKPFPEEWAGLKDDDLKKVTGINTARFCHNARFLCTTETLEDAIKLAEKAVKFDK